MKSLRPRHWILLLAVVLALMTLRPVKDDLWIHLLVGEYIAHHSSLPPGDIYSYGENERPWVAHLWLSRLLTYLLQQLAGLVAVRLAYVLLALAFALSVVYFYRREKFTWKGAALAMVLAMVLALDRFRLRPHLFTMSFLYLGLAFLQDRWNCLEKKHIFALGAFTSLWVNLHSGGLLFPLLVGAWWLGEVVDTYRRDRTLTWDGTKVAAVAAVFIGSVITPYHLSLWFYIFEKKPVLPYISEYGPSWKYFAYPSRIPLALAVWLITPVIIWAAAKRKLTLSQILVSLPLLYLSWKHARFLYMLPIPLAWSVPSLDLSLSSKRSGLVATTSILILAGYFSAIRGPDLIWSLSHPDRAVSTDKFPVLATEYLVENRAKGRIYSYTLWNTYLLYHLYPRCKTFFDTRHIYGGMDMFHQTHVMAMGLEGQGELFDRYEIDYLVVDSQFAFAPGEEKRWKIVFIHGDREIVFVRR